MPVYGTAQAGSLATLGLNLTSLESGCALKLFDAETLTAPVSSIACSRGSSPLPGGITFSMQFASAPTSSVLIQGANSDVEAAYVTLYTSTNKQADAYVDAGRFEYYRAQLASGGAANALTVIAHR